MLEPRHARFIVMVLDVETIDRAHHGATDFDGQVDDRAAAQRPDGFVVGEDFGDIGDGLGDKRLPLPVQSKQMPLVTWVSPYETARSLIEIALMRRPSPADCARWRRRNVIGAAGYGDRFLHRTGHELGIDIHEGPFITASSETVLEEGMVFSIEPGLYLPGQFGIRLEEIVFLRAGGPEILSELSRAAFAARP